MTQSWYRGNPSPFRLAGVREYDAFPRTGAHEAAGISGYPWWCGGSANRNNLCVAEDSGARLMSYGLPILAMLLALLPTAARGGCFYKPFDFHPEKNDGVVVDVIVDGGSACTHNFGEGPSYTFTGISFERQPENGKLVKTGANRFI